MTNTTSETVQNSPIVASEPTISRIPSFPKSDLGNTRPLFHTENLPRIKRLDSRTISSLLEKSALTKSSSNPESLAGVCTCPHVLIADDDEFQHTYYKILFHQSLNYDGLPITKENIRVQLSFSGESLLDHYKGVAKCQCNNLMVVIVDYHMGDNKLNGVQVCKELRNLGFEGPLLLRTTESENFLLEKHKDFLELIGNKTINALLKKSDSKLGKEAIKSYMKIHSHPRWQ